MKNFLIEKLGGYTKDEMVKGIEYTIESVNELLEGKDVQYEIKSRDLHFEGRAVAGEIGINNCERVSLGSLIREAKAKIEARLEEIAKNKTTSVSKKKVAKKVAKKTITKTN